MRFIDLLKVILVLTLLSFFTACSDDDEGPTEPENGDENPPSLNVKQVSVPQAMQSAANNGDPGAAQAVAYIQLANTLPTYAQLFNPPEGSGKLPATSTTAGEWTWTQDGATFTLVSNETATTWEMTLTVDGSFSGSTYNNQVIMEASGMLDGSQGELHFYSPGSSSPAVSFNWETLADGTYHLSINSSEGSGATNIELYSYSDGSGSLDINVSGGGTWDIDWNSDGSGTWAHYDASGSLVDQGSWG